MAPKKRVIILNLTKSQLAALLATAVDFSVMVLLRELLTIPIVLAVATGAISGGVTNFCLNRYWVFAPGNEKLLGQAVLYGVICIMSAMLNAVGVAQLVTLLFLDYFTARIMVACIVSVLFNYPLHFVIFQVFRRRSKEYNIST